MQLLNLAAAALHGVSHDRPYVPQAGQVARGIGDGPRGKRVFERPELPVSFRHPCRASEPGEGHIAASSRSWHQDIDELRSWSPDAVVTQGRRTGDHAALTRV
jgi:hypothetical protein